MSLLRLRPVSGCVSGRVCSRTLSIPSFTGPCQKYGLDLLSLGGRHHHHCACLPRRSNNSNVLPQSSATRSLSLRPDRKSFSRSFIKSSLLAANPPLPQHISTSTILIRSSSGNTIRWLIAASTSILAIVIYLSPSPPSKAESQPDPTSSTSYTFSPDLDPAVMTSLEIPTGQPGNLLPEQEEKLREFWAALLKLCGVHQDGDAASVAEPAAASQTDGALGDDGTKVKKKRLGIFSRKQPDAKKGDTVAAAADAKPAATAATADQAVATDDPNDKYGQTKQFRDTLATMSPEQLHETLWTMVKHDHPDALCLRFLRARKWDVQKALVMLVATMNWRATQMHVDSDIMRSGEEGALADCQSEDAKIKKVAIDFMSQMRQGKTILHGVDKRGNPVCITRVRLHKIGEQSEEALERYTVYLIETTRMVLRPPVETATMVFDMTGFSMANMVGIGVVDSLTDQFPVAHSCSFPGLYSRQVHHQVFRGQLS